MDLSAVLNMHHLLSGSYLLWSHLEIYVRQRPAAAAYTVLYRWHSALEQPWQRGLVSSGLTSQIRKTIFKVTFCFSIQFVAFLIEFQNQRPGHRSMPSAQVYCIVEI